MLENAYDEQPNESEVKNESDLEKMFFVASKKEQFSIVSNFFLLNIRLKCFQSQAEMAKVAIILK